MVQVGLVAYVEEQLEREISLRRLPRNGLLGSEQVLALRYGVSRSTVREALRRLAARGLVVQRPGRVARAVALDESLTLENLGMALHDERSEECRRLLEGYFSLKRQVLVELLVDCCASASEADRHQLEATCFNLWDLARWEPGARCAQLEFELLRLAAQAAARPGHLLLIQSLQRAMRGKAARLLSFIGGESLRQWAVCAMHALSERDARAIQHQLPALLKACDEGVLDAFAPVPQGHASPEDYRTDENLLEAPTSSTAQDEALEARSCVEEHGSTASASVSEQDAAFEARSCVEGRGFNASTSVTEQNEALEARSCGEARGLDAPALALQQEEDLEERPCVEERGLKTLAPASGQDDAFEARPCAEDDGLGGLAPVAEDIEVIRLEPCPLGPACPLEPASEVTMSPAAPGLTPCEPGGTAPGRT
ncbi:FadR/GntR family transcriptional regulator [Corallococcus exercitus]|uniref:GntR family transcriptional regulator n=1 Tax=Corallococcus exercitus TaxID=2316736 RepID=A0A7Y4JT77_9BACT|nr:GntR family transcriptional regulator [Corallococcus exercitus]NOK10729.1 GntR family transcriptional regulator [Corallococcus exercitus]